MLKHLPIPRAPAQPQPTLAGLFLFSIKKAGVSSEGKISVLRISDVSKRQGTDWSVEATEQSSGYVLTMCLGMTPDEVTNAQVEFQKNSLWDNFFGSFIPNWFVQKDKIK